MKNKAAKLEALIAAVKRLNTGEVQIPEADDEMAGTEEENRESEEEVDNDGSDSE